jgi:hypothetical protein
MPSPDAPLTGGCLCGAVRFRVTEPLAAASSCHCTNCQRRTGTAWSVNTSAGRSGFALLAGSEHLRSFTPEGGLPKWFCTTCGSHLFSGDGPLGDAPRVNIRLGAFDADPGVRIRTRQYLRSAAPWELIPEDEAERFDGPRPPG